MSGIYLPYWWADCEVDIDYVGEGINIRVWRAGDREYTETKKYELIRKGKVDINNVGELAFTKIDEGLLDGIAPYNEREAKDFSMPYLSGFFAEQYDIKREEVAPKVEDRVKRYSKYIIDESISGFTRVHEKRNNSKVTYKAGVYPLACMDLNLHLQGQTYVYAVNGQTGKSFELPFCKEKALKVSGIIFAATFGILLLGVANMVRSIRKLFLLFPLILMFIFNTINVYANKNLVFDDAGLFTQEERLALKKRQTTYLVNTIWILS